jgi:uncharacterized membrane protein
MFETSVDIAARLDDVWEVLVDAERWPEWTASVSEVELLDGGPLVVGSRARIRQPRLPATVWEVTDLEPGHAFTWKAVAPGVTTVGDHRLSPDGADRTRAMLGIRRSGPLAPLVDLVFRGLTARYVTMEAEGLKNRCEAGSERGSS